MIIGRIFSRPGFGFGCLAKADAYIHNFFPIQVLLCERFVWLYFRAASAVDATSTAPDDKNRLVGTGKNFSIYGKNRKTGP